MITYLPEGDTLIDHPINDGFVIGGVYQGVGNGQQKSPSHPQRGDISAWVWNNANYSQPMVRIEGAHFSFRDLCLYGHTRVNSSGRRPAQGFLIRKPKPGIGTGKCLFEQVYIEDCEVGIQASAPGVPPNAENSDNCTYRKVTFRDCDVGFRAHNIQNHQHQFTDCVAYKTGTMFQFHGGGKSYFEGCGTFDRTPTTFLDIAAVGSTTWWRQGIFVARNTTWDSQKPPGSPLLKMNKQPGANLRCMVNFDGFTIANHHYPVGNPLFQISGGTVCRLQNGVGLQAGCLHWWDEGNSSVVGKPTFLLDNCRMDPGIKNPLELFHSPDSKGWCIVHVRDCATWNGKPITDIKTGIQGMQ